MKKRLTAVALLLLPIIGAAESLPEEKEGIVPFCSTCHGVNGVSTLDHIPNLWGQSEQYLHEQVENFRSKKRHTTFMDAFIYQISDEQMATIVKHYSSVPNALTFDLQWRGDKWPGDMKLGEKIAYSGKMEANIPACVACHGPSGVGVKPSFPRLAGQNAAYLINQMKSWKDGTRPPGAMALMGPIANGLTDEEIKAVSGYFASLGQPIGQQTAEVKK
ncbi:c-type cytochrome [Vibrio aphrogenes]|uniref:c-type cytochrome n=1 Tax=Vibrio aphrogenes TaxID=1891186 RepID=UPI000B35CCB6|nr:c-type cytochrome [Vibrio aphrogenes]